MTVNNHLNQNIAQMKARAQSRFSSMKSEHLISLSKIRNRISKLKRIWCIKINRYRNKNNRRKEVRTMIVSMKVKLIIMMIIKKTQ